MPFEWSMPDNNKTCIKEHVAFKPETIADATWKYPNTKVEEHILSLPMKGWEEKYSCYPPPPPFYEGGGCVGRLEN